MIKHKNFFLKIILYNILVLYFFINFIYTKDISLDNLLIKYNNEKYSFINIEKIYTKTFFLDNNNYNSANINFKKISLSMHNDYIFPNIVISVLDIPTIKLNHYFLKNNIIYKSICFNIYPIYVGLSFIFKRFYILHYFININIGLSKLHTYKKNIIFLHKEQYHNIYQYTYNFLSECGILFKKEFFIFKISFLIGNLGDIFNNIIYKRFFLNGNSFNNIFIGYGISFGILY